MAPKLEPGFRRMQIVEVDSDEEDVPDSKATPAPEMFPDVKIERTREGIEKAKDNANSLFAKGDLDGAARWFSKCIWLVDGKHVSGVPTDLQSVLHSNRAFVMIKKKQWEEAEKDSASALALNGKNTKARYRRAMALHELGLEAVGLREGEARHRRAEMLQKQALEAVEEVLMELPDPRSNKEAIDLKKKIQDSLAQAAPQKAASPKSEAPGGFRRMQIVEASDSDEEEQAAEKAPSGPAELYPEIAIARTKEGIEKAKDEANKLFAKGSLDDSAKWFSKCLWLLDQKIVTGCPSDLHSILHSNRAFVRVKQQQWELAEKDCAEALRLNPKNTKARYRRAIALYELGKDPTALETITQVLKELPDPNSNKEAVDLKGKIEARMASTKTSGTDAGGFRRMQIVEASDSEDEETPPKPAQGKATETKAKPSSPPAGFKRMQIVEADDSDEEETPAPKAAKAKPAAPAPKASSPPAGFKRMQIVEADDSDEEDVPAKAAKKPAQEAVPSKAKPSSPSSGFKRMQIVEASDSDEEESPTPAPKANAKAEAKAQAASPPSGFKRMQIVEASDSEDDSAPVSTEAPYPDIQIAATKEGVTKAKDQANALFAKGSLEESARWFSKCIWLAENRNITDLPRDVHSVLHSNRAFIYVKQQKWQEAEADCTAALALNDRNTKARYRRAMALHELKQHGKALIDVQAVLAELPDAKSQKEATELEAKIKAGLAAAAPAPPKSSSPAAGAGFKRMQIVEASDSEEEEDDKKNGAPPKPASTTVKPPSPAAKASPKSAEPAPGFTRMNIVEVDEDSEDDQPPAPKPASPKKQAPAAELYPEVSVAHTKEGIEKGKDEANKLFAKGSLDESAKWFSKCIWLLEQGLVKDCSKDLHSILHSNRAFVRVKQQQWAEAEKDCGLALSLNPKNTKARYRRAIALYELKKDDAALEAISEVLRELPDPNSNKEAVDLKAKIQARMKTPSPKAAAGKAPAPPAEEQGFRRMQIVEASDSEEEEDKATPPPAKATSPAKASESAAPKSSSPAAAGFKRMQIVEESDSEEENSAPHPDIDIEATREGVTKGKDKANYLFAQGSLDESARWFTKCIWVVDNNKVAGLPIDLHSVLHSNRAFVYVKQKKWQEAEVDCTAAIALNEQNTKARYRRAMARFELKQYSNALADIQAVIKELPDPKSQKEATELEAKIKAAMKRMQIVEADDSESEDDSKNGTAAVKPPSPAAKPPSPAAKPAAKAQENSGGWKRMVIHDATDSESEEEKAPPSQAEKTSPSEPAAGFTRMKIVEVDEDSDEEDAGQSTTPQKSPPLPSQSVQKSVAAATGAATTQEADKKESGWKKMQIVEASDSEEEEVQPPAKKPASSSSPAELYPEITIECSKKGIEAAKDKANSLFGQGAVDECVKWFSKCLWLLETKRIAGIPVDTHSILHSNRAFAYIKLKKWEAALDDCNAALKLNAQNIKAKYRRGMALYELGEDKAALQDVEVVITSVPDPKASRDAVELKAKIEARLQSAKAGSAAAPAPTQPAAVAKPASPAKGATQSSGEGWKRMQIVEASDSEEEEEPEKKPTSPAAEAKKSPELHPDIIVGKDKDGIEKAKNTANSLFAKGDVTECVRWFDKCIWLVDNKLATGVVPADLQSILHSNRAFGRMKLKQWATAEEDCTKALELNGKNSKALYRRATCRYELEKFDEAMKDVKEVMQALTDEKAHKEAVELKAKIYSAQQKAEAPAKAAATTTTTSSSGWKKMQIVEESESEDENEAAAPAAAAAVVDKKAAQELYPDLKIECSKEGMEKAKNTANSLYAKGNVEEAIRWFSKCIWLVDNKNPKDVPSDLHCILYSNRSLAYIAAKNWAGAEEDCTAALDISAAQTKARYRRATARYQLGKFQLAFEDVEQAIQGLSDPNSKAMKEAVELRKKIKDELGWKRLNVVEVEEDSDEEEAEQDPFPDINVDASRSGIEKGKDMGNSLFAKGSVSEAVRWFSKCIWLVESKRVATIPGDLCSILHSNRAFAEIKLEKWSEAESDCTAAMKLNPGNLKAKYRRAWARSELGQDEAALKDVEEAIRELQDAKASSEAVLLRDKLKAKLAKAAPATKPAPAVAKPAEAKAETGGWKRMNIVEESDSEEDGEEDPFPDIKVDAASGRSGIEKGKDMGNSLFAKGSVAEAVRWFSKCLWLIEKGRVATIPADLHSILHSNRAFAEIKLEKWSEAESDCTAALKLNPTNLKAMYRRAWARSELGQDEAALKDVESVIKEFEGSKDAKATSEAVALRDKLKVKLAKAAPAAKPVAKAEAQTGWKRMNIVEESESEDEEDAKQPVPVSAATPSSPSTPPRKPPPPEDPYPDIDIKPTREGVEAGKEKGNALFAGNSVTEAIRWFSKCIWLVDNNLVQDEVPADKRSILHSNKAFALVKLQRWSQAEKECDVALKYNDNNSKARYRRAQARYELNKNAEALLDVDRVLKELSAPQALKDAEDLKNRLAKRLDPGEPAPKPPSPTASPSSPSSPAKKKVADVESLNEKGNRLFSAGSYEEALSCYGECISIIEGEGVADADERWRSTKLPALYSNRAFVCMKMERWEASEKDATAALILNPAAVKAYYRRSVARENLGKLEEALKDAEEVQKMQPNADVQVLCDRLASKVAAQKQKASSSQRPKPVVMEVSDTPSAPSSGGSSPQASPTGSGGSGSPSAARAATAGRRGAALPQVAPSIPASGPKNSFEMLRHFGSMKRHPTILARYVRERVPPAVVQSLFSRTPIEADDLATMLTALRTSRTEAPAEMPPTLLAEYLRQLLRTRIAETQFAMLSSKEKQMVGELLESLPAEEAKLRSTLDKILA
eukprot:TRINITY_DN605_c0_g1_i1.p1 TRINITY_DN605_c0_g1~~TRINITY_DN605_c0_g1_i1.p1  ORF type:complete len:2835 (-),score=990.43 TRINITY_DN605_c0_g1_i1:163-8667(-)